MQISRTRHDRDFTVIPNAIAKGGLSLAARGLLVTLLAQRDGTVRTVRSLTEGVAEGQTRVTHAMQELRKAGYVTCERSQTEAGHWTTLTTVYDRPQSGRPGTGAPHSGERDTRSAGPNPGGKNQVQNPPTPDVEEADQEAAGAAEGEGGDEHQGQEQDAAGAAVLDRVGRVERRLRLGVPELLELAPLASEWLARGASEADIREALTDGLPAKVRRASKVVRWRLENKMPAAPAPAVPPLADCSQCRGPLPRGQVTGICSGCAGVAKSARPAASSRAITGEAGNLLAAIRERRATGSFAPGARSRFAQI
ncbi:hypothetical protein [Kitasatospora cineracea]|uniref:hypothetical protein n=1 Tax=Kitasatospora cineracea TaxID=88074 RepID=UPI00381F51B0